MAEITRELVDRALDGDAVAQKELVDKLTPVIQWRVATMLRRWHTGDAAKRDLHQEVEDLTQEVFLELFKTNAKPLRDWDPERLPLEAYAGYIAWIRAAGVLRSRQSPWREEPHANEDLPDGETERNPEQNVLSRNQLRKISLCLFSRFKPPDASRFDLLFLQERSSEEVAITMGQSLDAIYKWKSRLREWARACRERVSKPQSDPNRQSEQRDGRNTLP